MHVSLSLQCPKKVVTEAPPVAIPTPAPTVVEQQRGPQVNCSCPAGDKVQPSTSSSPTPPIISTDEWDLCPLMLFFKEICTFISRRERPARLVLQVRRVKRSSTAAFTCSLTDECSFFVCQSCAASLLCERAYLCRGTPALWAPPDRLASGDKKEKLYENLCETF